MRSGTSCFDLTIFKKTVARFWPLWGAWSVLWLILMPLQGLMLLRMDRAEAASNIFSDSFNSNYLKNFADHNVPGLAETALVLAVIFGVLAAMAVFSHLYNARSANLFGSLPVTREGLFLTHYLAGLAFLIVPNVVIFLLTLLVEAAGGAVAMEGLLFWLAASCGECFFFYSLAVFCAMFTGHLLALPAFYGIVNVLAAGVITLFHTVLHAFYYGFAGFSGWVGDVVEALTPVVKLSRSVSVNAYGETLSSQWVREFSGWGTLGAYALAALALTVCAFFLYRARRLESAGDVVSVRPMRPVFKYGMAFCVGMLFGMGTAALLGGGEITLMISILIWAAIGYFAAQMLLDKSFRVFRRWKGAAAVAAVFIALFLVVGLDLTGYETRVPDAANVKSVHVEGLSAVGFQDTGDIVDLDIEDPKQIELLTVLHQAAVDQGETTTYVGSSSPAGCRLELDYTLNNGSTLRRSYYMEIDPAGVDQEGTAAWALERLYHDPELYWRVYEFDKLEEAISQGGRLDNATFDLFTEDKGTTSLVAGYGADARALLDAVEEDMRAGRIGVRTLTSGQFYVYRPYDSLIFWVNDPTGRSLARVNIALQDTASSTLAELSRLAGEDPTLTEALKAGGWIE